MNFATAESFQKILTQLCILKYVIKARGKHAQYDINTTAENFVCTLLNLVYSFELKNANHLKLNFPAVDLVDETNRVCVQVTSQRGRSKVKKTVKTFIKKELYEDYERLIVLVLGDKTSSKGAIDTKDKFEFNAGRDVIDIDDLLREIETKPPEELEEIENFVTKEMKPFFKSLEEGSAGLLENLYNDDSIAPVNAESFMAHHEFDEDSDKHDFLQALLRLFDGLKFLGEDTRQYFCAAIYISNEEQSTSEGKYIFVYPNDIEGTTHLDQNQSLQHFKSLEARNLMDYDCGDDGIEKIVLRVWTESGINLIWLIKEYVGNDKDKLKAIIVDRNFSTFD
jgi:hypothetical protein